MKRMPLASLALLGLLCVLIGVALLALSVQGGSAQPADARYFQAENAGDNSAVQPGPLLPATGAEGAPNLNNAAGSAGD